MLPLEADDVSKAAAGISSLVIAAEWFVLVPTVSETPLSYIPHSTTWEGTLAGVGDCTATCKVKKSQ